jgi:hypothetical protein
VGSRGQALNSSDDRGEDTWKDHQYLVEWVDEAKEWAKTYQIQEYISADQEGRDPSGLETCENQFVELFD